MTFTCCNINLEYDEIMDSQMTYAKVLHPEGEFYSSLNRLCCSLKLLCFSGFWETTNTLVSSSGILSHIGDMFQAEIDRNRTLKEFFSSINERTCCFCSRFWAQCCSCLTLFTQKIAQRSNSQNIFPLNEIFISD